MAETSALPRLRPDGRRRVAALPVAIWLAFAGAACDSGDGRQPIGGADGAGAGTPEVAVPDGATEVRIIEATSVSAGDLELSTSVRGEGDDAVAVLTVYDLRDEDTPFEVVELAAGETATVFDHELTALTVRPSSPPDEDVEGGHDGGVELAIVPPG